MTYGNPPIVHGVLDFHWHEYMHYLYLPVKMSHQPVIRLPERLTFLGTLVEQIVEAEDAWDAYAYVSARRGYASPGNPLNRPGWHADGFGTDDINYVWADRYPTRFAVQEFHDIGTDHVLAAEQFDAQVDLGRVVTYPDSTLLRLDPSVVHSVPTIPAPGGERGFVKVSLSRDKYNLRGNSHNYLFNYDWHMWGREEIRNDPAYAGGDSGPRA